MTDFTTQLLKLINNGKTLDEISETLGISHKQVYNILTMIRNKGFEFDRKYYYNGDIVYVPKKILDTNKHLGVDIITAPQDRNFEALVISDLHIGSIHERIDILNKMYDYCAKEGIHIIIVCGDLIDGMFGRCEKIHDNIHDQIDYALKNYPFDKGIINFATLGDHDYDALKGYGQNFATVLESYRHDIVPLGYGFGQINVKNDRIIVKHRIEGFDRPTGNYNNCLLLKGHLHKMSATNMAKMTVVTIPSISGMQFTEDEMLPSAVRMNLTFTNGMISSGVFNQLLIDSKIHKINEFEYYLGYGKDLSGNNSVRLEEDRTKKKVLELPKTEEAKSQINKFNARWKI